MILKQIQLIGKSFLEGKSLIDVYIEQQKTYRSSNILVINVDLTSKHDKYKVIMEEYDKSKVYKYLRGVVGAGGSTRSPYFNLNTINMAKTKLKLDQIKLLGLQEGGKVTRNSLKTFLETEVKEATIMKDCVKINQELIKSMTKAPFKKLLKESIVFQFYKWVETVSDELVGDIIFEIVSNYFSWESKTKKFKRDKNAPNACVFKIKNGDEYLYPGEISDFVSFYLDLIDEKKVENKEEYNCSCCNELTKSINSPTLGIYNLDMTGFIQGFVQKKKSLQFSVCDNCNLEILEGLRIIDLKLNFFAYKTDNGIYGKDGVWVNHYIIPIVEDTKLLKNAVGLISRVKTDLGSSEKYSLSKEIEYISLRIKGMNRKRLQEIRRLENQKQDLVKRMNIPEDELGARSDLLQVYEKIFEIEKVSDQKIGVLDVFYHITDYKQNPSTKEILAIHQVNTITIQKIHEAIIAVNSEFQNSRFYFRDIQKIVRPKLFQSIMSSIFTLVYIDIKIFYKHANDIIMRSFKYDLIKQKRKDIVPSPYLIPIFKKSISFFNQLELIR